MQEEGGRKMVTYPRVLDHTVRKTDDRRKRKRAEKSERQAAEQRAQQAQVKRLKNLKNEEIQDRYPAESMLRAALHVECNTLHRKFE